MDNSAFLYCKVYPLSPLYLCTTAHHKFLAGRRSSLKSSNLKFKFRTKMTKFSRDLPMELVTEVLIRLPVKTIVQFRCVCKAWCSQISSLDFVSLHLAHVQNKEHDPPFLTSYICGRKTRCMLRSSDTYKKIVGRDYRIRIPQHLEDLENYHMIGTCANGLLLLVKSRPWPWEVVLWNPLLGKTHTLPPIRFSSRLSFGHGLNSLSNDYKVVVISTDPHTSVHVYDFSVRTWRRIIDYDESILGKVWSDGVLMEGNIHWVSLNFEDLSSHIISFDVNNEVFNYMMLPSELGVYDQVKYPVIYRDKLGLLNVFTIHLCSLWVMEKDQAPGSWIKLYQVDLSMNVQFFLGNPIRILNFKKNGQLLFATRKGGIKLYDFESQEMKDIMITFPSDIDTSYSILYKESLVLL